MKLKPLYIALLFSICSITACSVFAQNISVSATMDSNSILIGNRAHIKVEITYDIKNGPVSIQWTPIGDTLVSKVPVVKKSKIDTVIPDSTRPTMMRQIQNLTITCFDSGYYAIPPFDFIINGDTAHKQSSEALMLQVRTIPIDTAKGIKDIKAPIQVPFSWLEILPYIGWGLLGLAVIAAIVYFLVKYFKNKKPEPIVIKEPPVPIDVKALKALEELGMKKLWQEGKIKEYQSGITDILREYIDARFGIQGLES